MFAPIRCAQRLGLTARSLWARPLSVALFCSQLLGCESKTLVAEKPRSAANVPAPKRGVTARRLSHDEYRRTLRDVFPFADLPKLDLALDPAIDGFENQSKHLLPSALLVQQYEVNAKRVVAALAPHWPRLVPCDPATGHECAKRLIRTLGRRLYRRPLTEGEVSELVSLFDTPASRGNFQLGASLATLAMLQSPAFLYHLEGPGGPTDRDGLSPHQLASRLSTLIWASAPDEELLDAADTGRLETTAELSAQAERLLNDPKADGLTVFLDGWLQPERLMSRPTVSKQLAPELRRDLLESARRFSSEAFMHGTVEQLLLGRTYPTTPAILTLLTGSVKAQAPWQSWIAESEPRRGWLGHPAWLAAHAHDGYPSPVLRGVYVMDRLLCAPPSPPPPNVTRRREELNDEAALTNRQKYQRSTSGPGCHGCHSTINALGFAFELYDEVGRYRSVDAGQAIDSSGKAFTWRFDDATELSQKLATSERVQRCVVEKWLTYAFGAEPSSDLTTAIFSRFETNAFQFRTLVETTVRHPRFRSLEP